MPKVKIGSLPPRYSMLLNSHEDVRLSKCPKCQKLTHLRKFALFIHIDSWGPMALGKTCRYCSRCEVVMVSRKELEAEIARGLSRVAPEVIGKDYLVLGTIEKRIWQYGLGSPGKSIAKMLKHLADFKHQYDLEYKPGGWDPVTQEPKRE
jgi:Zn-finger nucleic acid-binding protein